jgi:hypothetical protein
MAFSSLEVKSAFGHVMWFRVQEIRSVVVCLELVTYVRRLQLSIVNLQNKVLCYFVPLSRVQQLGFMY